MIHLKFMKAVLCLAALAAAIPPASGQLTINGVTDKSHYNDSVSFTVVTQAGFTFSVFLNTNPVPVGVPVTVSRPDYYELAAQATETATSAVTNRLIRFLVNDSSRDDTEWGLPPQTPWPVIQSAASEFAGAALQVIVPRDFPAGYEIPVVAWARSTGANSNTVRANGLLAAAGHPSIQLKRGVGSGFLSSSNAPGTLNYAPTVAGLSDPKTINIEAGTTWTTVSGPLGATTWPAGSRIHVTGNLTLTAGATLTVGEGTIVRLNSGVVIYVTNNCTVAINGTTERPVVFMPTVKTQPWGGFVQHANNAEFIATGAIFTGSGLEPCWYAGEGCSSSISGIGSHRGEQALVSLVGSSCNVTMTDCAAISMAGQLGHAVGNNAAYNYKLVLTRFLMQRASTGGEYTRANFKVNDSAFIDCPDDTVNFVNGDNDGLYLIGGVHAFTNTLFGWTKDDGVDSGGTDSGTTGFGKLDYQSCWFEATFHEGNSLSGYKNTYARDTVYLGCGQGIENGYNGPTGRVDHCLFAVNQVGVRHGDNYENNGDYTGRMTATNCLMLHNYHDVFGYNWRSGTGNGWTQALGQMFISANLLTVPNTNFPNNGVWDPAADAAKLGAFGAGGRVGAALAVRAGQTSLENFRDGIPVGLSSLCTNEVVLNYSVAGTDGTSLDGQLIFPPGKMRDFIPVPASATGVLRVALSDPVNADLTGVSELLFQNYTLPPPAATMLSPLGATWRYLDNGTDQGAAWRAPGFADANWSNGVGRLGFGPDAAAVTTIRRYYTGTSGPQITNYYFRRAITVASPRDFATMQFRYQRDDGCVVYLNGSPIITNNMPAGVPTYLTLSATTISGATETQRFWTNTIPASQFLPGVNVIAVEVHQASATSSDIAWEMELQGLPTPPPALVNISSLGGNAVVYWGGSGFTLVRSPEVKDGAWTTAGTNSPVSVNPVDPRQFFRLRKP